MGGYSETRLGWEDYDFWCRMAEAGLNGHHVAYTELAQYRVHGASMLQTVTETAANKARVMTDITARHPWLSLVYEMPEPPASQLDNSEPEALSGG